MKKNRSSRSKTSSNNWHARVRGLQRHGISFGPQRRREFVRLIQSNEAEFIERQSINRTVWKITHEEEIYKVVYDKKTKTIITFLPR